MPKVSSTYVEGHANPDTDSVALAIGYAWLLSQRDDSTRASMPSVRCWTRFVAEEASISLPCW